MASLLLERARGVARGLADDGRNHVSPRGGSGPRVPGRRAITSVELAARDSDDGEDRRPAGSHHWQMPLTQTWPWGQSALELQAFEHAGSLGSLHCWQAPFTHTWPWGQS